MLSQDNLVLCLIHSSFCVQVFLVIATMIWWLVSFMIVKRKKPTYRASIIKTKLCLLHFCPWSDHYSRVLLGKKIYNIIGVVPCSKISKLPYQIIYKIQLETLQPRRGQKLNQLHYFSLLQGAMESQLFIFQLFSIVATGPFSAYSICCLACMHYSMQLYLLL